MIDNARLVRRASNALPSTSVPSPPKVAAEHLTRRAARTQLQARRRVDLRLLRQRDQASARIIFDLNPVCSHSHQIVANKPTERAGDASGCWSASADVEMPFELAAFFFSPVLSVGQKHETAK
jgi:hypothetical protein